MCEEKPKLTKEEFVAHLKRASAIVASWPEWKRNILVSMSSPTVKTPREPICQNVDY